MTRDPRGSKTERGVWRPIHVPAECLPRVAIALAAIAIASVGLIAGAATARARVPIDVA